MKFLDGPISDVRVRVKICGITRIEDALAAAEAGADAIGLVFYEPSPRAVSISRAGEILEALPDTVSSVGLFVNADEQFIWNVLQKCSLDYLQFHGQEVQGECCKFSIPFIKALRVENRDQIQSEIGLYPAANAILFDSYDKKLAGGTGQIFNWSDLPKNISHPVILAGGLNPDNVQSAIHSVRPYAVDVSGGVEKSKGIKDPDKIQSFIKEVNNAVISK